MAAADGEGVRPTKTRGERESDRARGADGVTRGEVSIEADRRVEMLEKMVARLGLAPDRVGGAECAEHAVVGERLTGAKVQRELVHRRESHTGADARTHRAAAQPELLVTDGDRSA